jgi:type I restriction enzyme S subunit
MNTPELVGANVYVDKNYPDLYLPDRLWLLDVKDKQVINVRWLALVLASERYRKRLSELATGTSGTMKNLSKKLVLGLKLKLPPITEQERIAAIALALDERLSADSASLHQLISLRAALAQELVSGRLPLPESIIARHRDKAGQAA